MIKMIMFDLDDTIVDSKSFEYYREQKKWEKLDECINDFKVLCNAKEAIDSFQKNGLIITVVTTSPKSKYAMKILEYFDINIPHQNVYGYEELNKYNKGSDLDLPIKTKTICTIKKDFNIENTEVIFIGDSEKDFRACASSNIPFISLKDSKACKFFDNKLIYVKDSYFELNELIHDFDKSEYIVHKRDHQYLGEFVTFSNYIKDIFNSGEELGIPYKITYDSMHERLIDLKNNNMKSAVNWLYLMSQLPLIEYFEDVDFVVRALGSEECVFDFNKITTLDLIGFYIASKINAKYKPTLLTKKEGNEKLHLSGKNRALRKDIISGKYDSSLSEENKTVLVLDDIVTTGSTLEEIKRAITDEIPSTNVRFSTIAETVNYEKELYLDNICNSHFFYCANDMFNYEKYNTFSSILAVYLYYNFSSVEQRKTHAKGKYITYILDISDIQILNKKPNKYVYVSLLLNDDASVIIEKTRIDFFDNLEESKLYKNPKVPSFVKEIMVKLFNQF